MTTRTHAMPFGAEKQRDGRVRFRLWAPGARRVNLCLESVPPEPPIPMQRGSAGWFEITPATACVGMRYRFQVDGHHRFPDPASRFQPLDVHGPSEVIAPDGFDWDDADWNGRPWEEAIIYELHVGTFTREGTFLAILERLDHLVDLGVTAIQLMPIADFPGARNWGYDGVLPFAPDSSYGTPEDLKQLIQAAHGKGLMAYLDVVYNHFGPDGNYLHDYAPQFFDPQHHTPWGAAIDFDGPYSRTVRDFFIHNALFWLNEYHFDGLRLDAVHTIRDTSRPHILRELSAAVRKGPGKQRHIHLVLENADNRSRYLNQDYGGSRYGYAAQWNDDFHAALHVATTGESGGQFVDFADRPVRYLARALAEGFAYQGEPSLFRQGRERGEPSAHLPPTAFLGFIQNHDQVGNRPYGERIDRLTSAPVLHAALTILLLAPQPPLLFMGQEFLSRRPFLYFCDFHGELARAVTEGRRRTYTRLAGFEQASKRDLTPDPNDPACFERSILDWESVARSPHRVWLARHKTLLQLRHREIVPRLAGTRGGRARYNVLDERGLILRWELGDDSVLTLLSNLSHSALPTFCTEFPWGNLIYSTEIQNSRSSTPSEIPPWYAAWFLECPT